MSEAQKLRRVELPLAMPMIVAGIRTSAVWIVGTATLSTPVGAKSLGNFIFSGLQTRNYDAVAVGCVAAAGLAMLLDQLIRLLETGAVTRSRARLAAGGVPLALLYAIAAAGFASDALGPDRPVTIGSKTFTEQYILSELLAERIRRETGLPTEALQSLGSTVAFDTRKRQHLHNRLNRHLKRRHHAVDLRDLLRDGGQAAVWVRCCFGRRGHSQSLLPTPVMINGNPARDAVADEPLESSQRSSAIRLSAATCISSTTLPSGSRP